MSTTARTVPSCPVPVGFTQPTSRRRLNLRKLGEHLADVGALHTGLYRLLRDLVPALVLSLYWLWTHPGVLFHSPAWWYQPRVSLLEIGLLVGVTLLSRLMTGGQRQPADDLLSGEIAANLIAGLVIALSILPVLATRLGTLHALRVSAEFFVATTLLSATLLAVTCLIGWFCYSGLVARREVLIVGSGPAAHAVFEDLVDSPVYHVAGILDDNFMSAHSTGPSPTAPPSDAMRERYLGGLDRLDALLREHPVSIVFCALPVKSMYMPMQQVIEVCERIGVEVRHPSSVFQTRIARLDRGTDSGRSYSILRMVRDDSRRYVKRGFDLVGASALLLFAAPIMLAAAIAIKVTSPGPAFFAQSRYGLYRRRFRIYKMRTMVADAEALQTGLEASNEQQAPVFKMRRDPRVTRVGAFLRKSSIDELPQLWNVLAGDMSLVGPRPLAVRDVLRIEDSAQLRRFSVKPGITCIWQMSGRNNTDFTSWIKQDLEYIDNWSLLLDLRILVGTIPAVLRGDGAM